MTIEQESARILAWEGCYNVRDLGGYPTEDGRETQWGRVVRSDNLIRLSEAGRAALLEYGVRTIIDLRLPRELEIDPPPFRNHHVVDYQHLSFVDPSFDGQGTEFTTLANDYIHMLERFSLAVGQIMSAIAGAGEGAVLIHCHAGKDRTGIISALLLRLAGVPLEVAADDYGLTDECIRPLDEEWLENGPNDRAWREREIEDHRARAEVMHEVLRHLEDRYGSVENYLRATGLSSEDVDRLRDRLLE